MSNDVLNTTLPDGPCLVIEWRKADREHDRCDWIATYSLRFPIQNGDIRRDQSNFRDGFLYFEIGCTKSTGPGPLRGGEIHTPFRDGVHATLDATVLSLPAFVTYDGIVQRID